MKRLAVLVLIACLTNSGHANPLDREGGGRIIGGQDAPPNLAPYQVSIRLLPENTHYCGGVILQTRFVLTAGYCINGLEPDQMLLKAGSNKLSTGGEFYKPLKLILHEDGKFFPNDIGLVKTERPIRFYERVQPIALSPFRPPDGALIVQTGWGSTSLGGFENITTPDNLQVQYVANVGMDRCRELAIVNPIFHESQMCTVSGDKKGHCYGDSGGPLVYNNKLVGLASYVFGECGTAWPDFSTSVAYFHDWIARNIWANS